MWLSLAIRVPSHSLAQFLLSCSWWCSAKRLHQASRGREIEATVPCPQQSWSTVTDCGLAPAKPWSMTQMHALTCLSRRITTHVLGRLRLSWKPPGSNAARHCADSLAASESHWRSSTGLGTSEPQLHSDMHVSPIGAPTINQRACQSRARAHAHTHEEHHNIPSGTRHATWWKRWSTCTGVCCCHCWPSVFIDIQIASAP